MARYRIELATVVELFADVGSMADAQQFALDFIAKNTVRGTPRYKLHAIFDTEREVSSDPSPSDSVTQNVAA
jgi:hypothetical protein